MQEIYPLFDYKHKFIAVHRATSKSVCRTARKIEKKQKLGKAFYTHT